MKVFGLGWALLNGYGQIVNGALIRANRLAFGWAEGYLCIGAQGEFSVDCPRTTNQIS